MFKGKKWIVLIALLATILFACAPAATPTPKVETKVAEATKVVIATAVPAEPIRIGIAAPFSGASAFIGEDANMGVTMAAEEINAQGGVLGHPLLVFIGDSACAPDQAVSSMRKMVEVDQVDVVVGTDCSSGNLAALPIIQQYGVPYITGASTNAQITAMAGVGGNKWEFRVNAHDGMMAGALSKMMAGEIKSTIILAANNDWGRGAAASFNTDLTAAGVEVKSIEYFEQGQPDYHSLLTKWKGMNPDAILLIMESHDGAIFMRQFRELRMTQKVYARGSINSAEFLADIKDDLTIGDGIVEATLWTVGANPDFDAAFQARWGTLPHVHSAMAYNAARYVVAEAVKIALQQTGKADRVSIRDALEKVSITTMIGPVKFDDHNQAHPNMVITLLDSKGNISVLKQLPTD